MGDGYSKKRLYSVKETNEVKLNQFIEKNKHRLMFCPSPDCGALVDIRLLDSSRRCADVPDCKNR